MWYAEQIACMCEIWLYKLSLPTTDRETEFLFPPPPLRKEKQTAGVGERKGKRKRKLPEAGRESPTESRLSGGGGAGRFGRMRVCGTTARPEKSSTEEVFAGTRG